MIKILIVEDNEDLQLMFAQALEGDYMVYKASNGADALKLNKRLNPELIIADVLMPRMDGYDFILKLRESGSLTPVIMVTALDKLADKNTAFLAGADDYMTKPIALAELKMRINALLRRAKISNGREIAIGDFFLSSTNHEVYYKGEQIVLTAKEFALLYKLLSYPSRVFSKDRLMEEVWGFDSTSSDNTVRTHFNRLRKKLKAINEFSIVNIRSAGYKAVIKNKRAKAGNK